jgi:flagellar protein FlgJ
VSGLEGVPPLPAAGAGPTAAARRPGPAAAPATDAQIRQAAREFESLLLGQMIKGLRRTVPGSEDKGHEHQMYQELLDERLAHELAGRGGIGIAEALHRYLSPPARGARDAGR